MFSVRLPTTLTAAATAATAAGLVLRLVDLERTTAHVLTIQVLNGTRCIGAGHFHEAKAAWAACFAVIDQSNRIHRAMLLEQGTDTGLIGREGQVANVNLTHAKNLTNLGRLLRFEESDTHKLNSGANARCLLLETLRLCEP